MRPGRLERRITRSPRRTASRTLCVTKITVRPVSLQRRSSSSWSTSRVIASSAPKGSSMSRTSASCASERARATRWRMPPDSSWGSLEANAVRFTRSRSWSAWACRSPRGTFRIFSGSSTLPRAVSQGNSADSWNISVVRASPVSMVPALGRSSPAIRLSKVLFPQPEAPRRQTNSPGATSRVMLSSAWRALPWVPKTLETWSMTTAGRVESSTGGTVEDTTTSCGTCVVTAWGPSRRGSLAAVSASFRNDRS